MGQYDLKRIDDEIVTIDCESESVDILFPAKLTVTCGGLLAPDG
jgi:hypothetical protein